jgi:sialate O-acetylesterase
LRAELRLPAIFGDHMVMQAGQSMPVWGWSEAGETVKVVFIDEKGAKKTSGNATAGSDGRWRLHLAALPTRLAGRLLVQNGKGEKKEIADVMVGEVWLAGGQSNMSYRVGSSNVAPATLAEARKEAGATAPMIRFFMTAGRGRDTPQDDVSGRWEVAAPDTVARCSAVAWYFGGALHEKLHSPVGLIVSAVGGTPAEAWIPQAALNDTSVAAAILKRRQIAIAGNQDKDMNDLTRPFGRHAPARLYNGMIAGLGDFPVRGVIWFQADGNIKQPWEYGELIQTLVKSWRRQWQSRLPFYYVEMNDMHAAQQTPFDKKDEPLALIREQQNSALLLPGTGVVSAIDLGREGNPGFNAHFPVKKPVGVRLANLALAEVYEVPLGEVHSPEFTGYSAEGDKLRLHFNHAKGLRARGGGAVKGFVLKKSGHEWVWAGGEVDGETILVWNQAVPKPLEVRYAWARNPVTSIENEAGLPLRPFRAEIKEFAFGK